MLMLRGIAFVKNGKKEFVTVDFREVLTEIDKLVAAGATSIKVWKPECTCDAGWLLDADEHAYICCSCSTGDQLYERTHPEEIIPF